MAATLLRLAPLLALLSLPPAPSWAAEPAAAPADAARQPGAHGQPTTGKAAFREIAQREAAKLGLPFALVDAVMDVESSYRPDMIGGVGEIGLMQVRPATAAMLGFQGTAGQLADPAVNIHYGATYLAQAWRLAQGDVCRALMKYRAGHGEETMSPLSALYCQRARTHLASAGSPLAGAITPADLTAVATAETGAGPSLKIHGRPKTGAAFWSAFQSRIARINARIEAKWSRRALASR